MRIHSNFAKTTTPTQAHQASEQEGIEYSELAQLEPLESQSAAKIYGGVTTSDSSLITPSRPEIPPIAAAESPAAIATKPELWSDSLQTVLNQPPAALPRNLLLVGLLFCCAFGTWAWFGTIQEVSHAKGRLIPQGKLYKLQPVTQGEVAKILVKPGQVVQTGQLVAALDNRLAASEVERLKQSLKVYQTQLGETQRLLQNNRAEAEATEASARAEIEAQQASIAQIQTEASTSQTLLSQLQAETQAHQLRLTRLQNLMQEGAISGEQVFQAEQSLRDRQKSVTENQGQFEESLAKENQLQARLTQLQAEAQKSQLSARQQLQKLEIDAADLKAKIAETRELFNEAQTRLKQMSLYAPVDGVILSLNIANVGEVTQPGQTIAELAPLNAPLVLSAVLPSQEAGLVKSGMDVQVKLDAFPYQNYGIVSGKVLSISPDSKTDSQLGTVYEVEISLDRTYVTHDQQKVNLSPGQTAKAEIVIRKRRMMDILLEPIRQLQKGGISL